MNKPDAIVTIAFPVGSLTHVRTTETEPRGDSMPNPDLHLDYTLDDAPDGQPRLSSARQLLMLHVKQITSFLG